MDPTCSSPASFVHLDDPHKLLCMMQQARSSMFRHSPFLRMSVNDCEKLSKEYRTARSKLRSRNHSVGSRSPKVEPAFAGKVFVGNHSPVLNEETMWCPGWEAREEIFAPWPSREESEWEGNNRSASRPADAPKGFSRMLPLPRPPDAEWKRLTDTSTKLPGVKILEFDEVLKPPMIHDTHLPVDEIRRDDLPNLLGSGVAWAISQMDMLGSSSPDPDCVEDEAGGSTAYPLEIVAATHMPLNPASLMKIMGPQSGG